MNIYIIYAIAAVICFTGFYFGALDLIHAPDNKTIKTIYKLARPQSSISFVDRLTIKLGADFARVIKLSDYKKKSYKQKLRSAGIHLTPEVYLGQCFVIPVCLTITAIMLAIIIPVAFYKIIPLAFILFALIILVHQLRAADRHILLIREEIEFEMPRFVSTVNQYLKRDRNVVMMLEMYRRSAGVKFKRELDITIADMRSGNQESALMHLEARINSSMLSEVIRGLITAMKGDDSNSYFESLDREFRKIEYERLKKVAIKRPEKIKKYAIFLLFCFLAMFFTALGVEVMKAAAVFQGM